MTDDMKQRVIDAANQALKRSHEDDDFVDRTEVETEVLAGLLKLIQEQSKRIELIEVMLCRLTKR